MEDPWYKTTFYSSALSSRRLELKIPHDVFSTQRIDEGTLLLLENLPSVDPKKILDMGCGYGALGLPIAARFTQAEVEMVDRDLLAVKYSIENARANLLNNVNAYGSLGFKNIPFKKDQYDWILCNIPARIGKPFIRHFFQESQRRLTQAGEVRVVVIHDLVPLLNEIREEDQLPLVEVVKGERHTIFSMKEDLSRKELNQSYDIKLLYLRDHITFQNLTFDRPFDLGGDDPKRLQVGLPVLFDVLPRTDPKNLLRKILCFRCGYGILPLLSKQRWPNAELVAVDRDLLATFFTAQNAEQLNLTEKLEIRESAHFPDALSAQEKFNLILGELSPSAGEAVALNEIQSILKILAPGGQALLLCLEKIGRKISAQSVLTRDGYTVLRLGT